MPAHLQRAPALCCSQGRACAARAASVGGGARARLALARRRRRRHLWHPRPWFGITRCDAPPPFPHVANSSGQRETPSLLGAPPPCPLCLLPVVPTLNCTCARRLRPNRHPCAAGNGAAAARRGRARGAFIAARTPSPARRTQHPPPLRAAPRRAPPHPAPRCLQRPPRAQWLSAPGAERSAALWT
ncbi:MAG: hypothetical protein J3K34DRAFT_62942 [Monoraphidium minutum]|nr:MAG: hypothetical protein J3K34DRAFT_62942 [Monoraphidium minutum]